MRMDQLILDSKTTDTMEHVQCQVIIFEILFLRPELGGKKHE